MGRDFLRIQRWSTAVGFSCKGLVTHTRAARHTQNVTNPDHSNIMREAPTYLEIGWKTHEIYDKYNILNFICLLISELEFMFSALPFYLETFTVPLFFNWLGFVLIMKDEILVIHLTSVLSDLRERKTNTRNLQCDSRILVIFLLQSTIGHPCLPLGHLLLESHRPFKKSKNSARLETWCDSTPQRRKLPLRVPTVL